MLIKLFKKHKILSRDYSRHVLVWLTMSLSCQSFQAAPMLVWLMLTLSHPFKGDQLGGKLSRNTHKF